MKIDLNVLVSFDKAEAEWQWINAFALLCGIPSLLNCSDVLVDGRVGPDAVRVHERDQVGLRQVVWRLCLALL